MGQPPESPKIRQEKLEIGYYHKMPNRNEALEMRMNLYGGLLEDGDYDKWQPCCYPDGGYTEEEWQALKQEAYSMQPTAEKDTLEYKRQWCRIMWIRARFLVWMSEEWRLHQDGWLPTYYSITDYLESDWWKNSEHDKHWSVGPNENTPPEQAIDIRMERYGLFLEDDDFEKWQPCCYYDGGYTKEEWEKLRQEAYSLKPITLKDKVRTKWIQGRFIPWFSNEWHRWHEEYLALWQTFIKSINYNE